MNLAKNLLYVLLCLSFSIIIGAGIYEHTSVWPRAFAAPPLSLTMFDGEYGLNNSFFWQSIHPVVLLLFLLTIAVHWKSPRRKPLLIVLCGYLIIMVVTALYFVPELVDIIFADYPDRELVLPDLQRRGATWISLSWVRTVVAIGLASYLYLGLRLGEEGPVVVNR